MKLYFINLYEFLVKTVIFLFLLSFLIYNLEFFINYKVLLPQIKNKRKNKHRKLNDIINSRELFINELNLTKEYIRYVKPIKENEDIIDNKRSNEMKVNENFKERENNSKYFSKLCVEEILINSTKFELNENPLISIILPSFNKEKVLMKSIRSIQNQSIKNIEIIIVDDCSSDNSKTIYSYLLKTEPRVRIFTHLKNMGVWRTRIDGYLYSKGKYVIHFDTGDLYADEYVLEDAFKLSEKYKLDSVRMLFKEINNYKRIDLQKIPKFPNNAAYNKIVYKKNNIKKYNKEIFRNWGTLWTRFTRNYIFAKGLYLLNSRVLNIYKNFWEDLWWNRIADEVSNNLLIIKRYAYLYYFDGKGEGTSNTKSKLAKNKMIQEYIFFLYFELEFLPKNDSKKSIIFSYFVINYLFIN